MNCPFCGSGQYTIIYTVSCGQRELVQYVEGSKIIITEPIYQVKIGKCEICQKEFYL